jgi:hypothetical protein
VDRIEEWDGPKGGEYFVIRLGDGRALSISRKAGDDRVWLGRPDDPRTYRDQKGGIGILDRLLDDLRGKLATGTAEDRELYAALSELKRRRDAESH